MRATWLWVVVAAGCAGQDSEDDGVIEAAAANDVALTASMVGDLANEVAAINATVDEQGDIVGVGDCLWTWRMVGDVEGGTITASVAPLPCGGEVVGERAQLTYSVEHGNLTGVWATEEVGWGISMTGSRTASAMMGTADSEREVDTSWTLDLLDAKVDTSGLGTWTLFLTYEGLAGGEWGLIVDGEGQGAIDGTLTGPGEVECTVTGSAGDAQISC